jgi:hypothetical protein
VALASKIGLNVTGLSLGCLESVVSIVLVLFGIGESVKRGRAICAGVATLCFTPSSRDEDTSGWTVGGLRGDGDTTVFGNMFATPFDAVARGSFRSGC